MQSTAVTTAAAVSVSSEKNMHYFRVHHHAYRPRADSATGIKMTLIEYAIRLCSEFKRQVFGGYASGEQQETTAAAAVGLSQDQQQQQLRRALTSTLTKLQELQELLHRIWQAKGLCDDDNDACLPPQDSSSVLSFCEDEFRGLLLMCIASFQSMQHKYLTKIVQNSDNEPHQALDEDTQRPLTSNRQQQLQRKKPNGIWTYFCGLFSADQAASNAALTSILNRTQGLEQLLSFACKLAQERLDSQKLEFPFSQEKIDSNPIRMESQLEFFEELGDQYSPGAKTFFETLVRATAAHAIVKQRFGNIVSPHSRQLAFFAAAPVYMLSRTPYLCSNLVANYFSNMDATSAINMWQMMDESLINFFYNAFSLTSISTSLVFRADVSTLLPSGEEIESSVAIVREDIFSDGYSDVRSVSGVSEVEEEIAPTPGDLLSPVPTPSSPGSGSGSRPTLSFGNNRLMSPSAVHEDGSISMQQFDKCYAEVRSYLNEHFQSGSEKISMRLLVSDAVVKLPPTPRTPKSRRGSLSAQHWASAAASPAASPSSPHSSFQFEPDKVFQSLARKARLGQGRNGGGGSNLQSIFIHLHGGGWCSMSSNSHEKYLRGWAKQLGMPIVSIDYRLAPDVQFPSHIAEVYAGYRWVVQHYERALKHEGLSLRNVIVGGDSAGGNLSMGIAYLAIREQVRVPDALVLAYPSTWKRYAYSGSRLLTFTDPMLNCGFEKVIEEVYAGDHLIPETNPFISTSTVPAEILQSPQFPMTYMSFGSLDPLSDEILYAARRIARHAGESKLAIDMWDGLAHGFLSMIGVPESDQASAANSTLLAWIKDFIHE